MTAARAVLVISVLEAAHLTALVTQFTELVTDPAGTADPAVARLVPDAYRDDDEAAREFRALTQHDLLQQRADDAAVVLAGLHAGGDALDPLQLPADAAAQEVAIALDGDEVQAWLRTLAALRLVLASRLGIHSEDDHDPEDPQFGIYDWLGYRLDSLVQALA